jgi:hypothetical protein
MPLTTFEGVVSVQRCEASEQEGLLEYDAQAIVFSVLLAIV